MILPWQSPQWNQLSRLIGENRLPHAMLFTGLNGVGKATFATHFTECLFCSAMKADLACGKCHACRLIAGRAHPNVLWVEPEKAGGIIKVDQIREVTDFVNQSSLQGDHRVVIINPANNMNINAANALLKTLEEPSSGALLILIADLRNRLPATILSRCRRVVFPVPPKQQALEWLRPQLKEEAGQAETLLQIAQGAPLAAKSLIKAEIMQLRNTLFEALLALTFQTADPIKLAAGLEDDGLPVIDLVLSWIGDLIRLQAGISDIINTDYRTQLHQVVEKKSSASLQRYLQTMLKLRKQLAEGMNLNKQLVAESIFLQWT